MIDLLFDRENNLIEVPISFFNWKLFMHSLFCNYKSKEEYKARIDKEFIMSLWYEDVPSLVSNDTTSIVNNTERQAGKQPHLKSSELKSRESNKGFLKKYFIDEGIIQNIQGETDDILTFKLLQIILKRIKKNEIRYEWLKQFVFECNDRKSTDIATIKNSINDIEEKINDIDMENYSLPSSSPKRIKKLEDFQINNIVNSDSDFNENKFELENVEFDFLKENTVSPLI